MTESSQVINQHQMSKSFVDPFDDHTLLAYFEDIFRWHGFVRFVGLPYLREEPDAPIQSIFVEPRLSKQHIQPEVTQPEESATELLSREILTTDKLVLLGDPGSGKSTVLSWIAWQLTSPSSRELEPLSGLVPLPVPLREIELMSGRDTSMLVNGILDHPSLRRLRGYKSIKALLRLGQFYFLLDGLDEVPRSQRQSTAAAILEAVRLYPRCRWLITSRVVGYDEYAIEKTASTPDPLGIERASSIARRYVAPLDDSQMEAFGRRWFQRREEAPDRAVEAAREFTAAVRVDAQTRQLARIPNLLTLMALIYRMQARLPHGRALLYEKIVEAYLETIPAVKKIGWDVLSFLEKKRCLAHVAFEMQRSREEGGSGSHDREIVVSGARLVGLIADTIGEARANAFLEYVQERSGLIQKKGSDSFGFAHLSFQEYFTSLYLADRITSPRWISTGGSEPGTTIDDIRSYFSSSDWRETVVLLVETLATYSDWSDALLIELFGENLDIPGLLGAELAASLAVNPHSGLSKTIRQKAISRAWEIEITAQQNDIFHSRERGVLLALGSAQNEMGPVVWRAFTEVVRVVKPAKLSLEGCAQLPPLRSISLPAKLDSLLLRRTAFSDTTEVAFLKRLTYLSLSETAIFDLEPIVALKNLHTLDIGDTRIADVKPLLRLPSLRSLEISRLLIDPKVLAKLVKLKNLAAAYLSVEDFAFLEHLRDIEFLIISGTRMSNLHLLSQMKRLETLSVSFTNVDSLAPIGCLSRLKLLDLRWTHVSSIEAVRSWPELREVFLSGTPVTDISPLFALRNLKRVGLPESATERDIARLKEQFHGIEIT